MQNPGQIGQSALQAIENRFSKNRASKFMNSQNRTECRAVENLLVVLAVGELSAELSSQARAHLEVCEHCRQSLAELNRASQLAAGLKLSSPEVDRYPEFLRRLAASERQALQEAGLELVQPAKAALITDADYSIAPVNSNAEAGVAAVIPLFGNRLIVRNGFGGGFDLQLKSRQGRELVHVAANSLMKAAVIVGGFGIFAATSLFVIGFLALSYFQKPGEAPPPQEIVRPENNPPFGKAIPHNFPWIQTVTGETHTLAVWKAGRQIQAAFFDRQQNPISTPFILAMPIPPDKQPAEPALTDCALATDGESFVVIREQAGTLFAWNLNHSTERRSVSEMPIALGERALQPAIAWAGDRYLVVWVEPDPVWPKIKMLELDQYARPANGVALTAAETLHDGEKVGSPAVVAANGQALILYQKQGGGLMAKTWNATNGLNEAPLSITQQKFLLQGRVLTVSHSGEFFVSWRAMTGEATELNVARISADGKQIKSQSAVLTRMPVLTFDFRVVENRLALLWAENIAGGAQILGQRLSLDGKPSGEVTNLFAGSEAPMAFAFADAEGQSVIWHQHSPPQPTVIIRPIDWKKGL